MLGLLVNNAMGGPKLCPGQLVDVQKRKQQVFVLASTTYDTNTVLGCGYAGTALALLCCG